MSEHFLDFIKDNSKKYIYNIEKYGDQMVSRALLQEGIKEDVKKVITGRGGAELLKAKKSSFTNISEIDSSFDVKDANELVNPIIDGYRLSSFMLRVETENHIIKLQPLYSMYKL